MRRCAPAPSIIDTHVSLSPNAEERGYRGEHFDEVAGRDMKTFAASPTASWKNTTSFWADEDSLVRMFTDSGFDSVYKRLPTYLPDRTFYLCLPPVGFEPVPEQARSAAGKAAPGLMKRVARRVRG